MAAAKDQDLPAKVAAAEKAARKARRQQRRQQDASRQVSIPENPDPALLLGDIDAWNLRRDGDWLRFDARLEDGARAYRRWAAGGDILADAPGPLTALFALGGARRAGFNAGPARFRHNILAPGDHIGAVGLEGTGEAAQSADLQHLPHRSREALVADLLLDGRYRDKRGLPLYLTRAETDVSCEPDALASGRAMVNFLIALDNLAAAAARLGRPARVLSLGIGFGLEDQHSDIAGFVAGLRALMIRITQEMRARNLVAPIFLIDADCGTARMSAHPAIHGWQELARATGPHRLVVGPPSYMAEQDRLGRLTEAGRLSLAAMDAHAIAALESAEAWRFPLPLLAEYKGRDIRVTFDSVADLVVDGADPFGAGPGAGFHLTDTREPVAIVAVAVAADDPRCLILTCDHKIAPMPGGASAPRLLHACAMAQRDDGLSVNRSAIRDSWEAPSPSGDAPLHRWALPADLPLHPGGAGFAVKQQASPPLAEPWLAEPRGDRP